MIESPCTRNCGLDADGICTGCGRTCDQIVSWTSYTPEQRRAIMDRLPRQR